MQENSIQPTYLQEDEIDLRELFATIWNNKIKIIFFSFIVTGLTLAFVLSKPNSYKSTTLLAPLSQNKPSLGGLSALAGMAGVDIGGGGEVNSFDYLNTILKDYEFNLQLIRKYKLDEKIDGDNKNFVFAFGYREIYDYINAQKGEEKTKAKDEIEFDTYKKLTEMLNFSSDKKSGVITLSVESNDRFLAKELVDIYLKESTSYLRKLDMQDTDKKIQFYRQEMQQKDDIELKRNLASMVSSLIQKSVLSKSSEFYLVRQITKPKISYVKDKTKPKRGLILVVACVTSFILGIFGVFFFEFIKNTKEEDQKKQINN